MLTKHFVRDGQKRIIGSTTEGYQDGTELVHDAQNKLLGKVNHRFNTTRDAHGNLVSINTPDSGLLIGGDDE